MKLHKQTRSTQSLHGIQIQHIKVGLRYFYMIKEHSSNAAKWVDNKDGSLISSKSQLNRIVTSTKTSNDFSN